jgi:beta-lactamase superfamily II metal-dependent hydrolase
VLIIVLIIAVGLAVFWWLRNKKEQPPPPSGNELQVHVLDVGQGDSILIVSPTGKPCLLTRAFPAAAKPCLRR